MIVSSDLLHGRYRLDEVVASGATATVWRALDTQLDRRVAVKILDRQWLDAETEEGMRFRDEARVLARLSHPNIVTVFDSGTEDGVAFVVMELVDGRTVRSLLKDGVLPVTEATGLMAQVCDALAAAHAAGVVHRDIKPGNVVVTPGGRAKVCDFGIARLEDTTALTAPHVALGTSSYMAPEQIQGQALDGRADLYAVGCVLFEMLTGIPPFTGETAFSVAYQHVHAEPPNVGSLRAEVPSALDDLIERLLAKDPDGRPATAIDVRDALTACTESAAANLGAAGAGSEDAGAMAIIKPLARTRRGHNLYARAGLATVAIVAVPTILYAAWPGPDLTAPTAPPTTSTPAVQAAPPAAIGATGSAPPSGKPPNNPPGMPPVAVTGIGVATPSPSDSTSPVPAPSPPGPPPATSATQTPLEQVASIKTLVWRLSDAGQLAAADALELVRLLDEVANHITQGAIAEAQAKVSILLRKNDLLLSEGKISVSGHDTLETRLVRLSQSLAAMTG